MIMSFLTFSVSLLSFLYTFVIATLLQHCLEKNLAALASHYPAATSVVTNLFTVGYLVAPSDISRYNAYYNLLKTGSLDNAIREFSLA